MPLHCIALRLIYNIACIINVLMMNTHHVYCIVQGFVAGGEEGGRMAAMRGPSSFVDYKQKVAAMQQQQQQDAEATTGGGGGGGE
jgi:hypothetical protein